MFKKISKKQFLLCMIIIAITLLIPKLNQTTTYKITPAKHHSISTIIFDLNGVFFTTDTTLKYKLIWDCIWTNPSLLYYLTVFSVEQEYFKLLHSIPAVSDCVLYHKCKPMPQIMADWQIDTTDNATLKNKINLAIAESDYPASIKSFFTNIAHFMFTPELLANSQQPVQSMINIAKQLKASGYKIFALSNWDKESFQIVHDRYPEIFEIFDHFMISGHEQIAKPSTHFFQKLINLHEIEPEQCIFIDDESYNIKAAQQLGMHTILCTGTPEVIKQLTNYQIIT